MVLWNKSRYFIRLGHMEVELRHWRLHCDRRIMDPIEMEMNEMSFVGSSATSAGYLGLDRRRMNARN